MVRVAFVVIVLIWPAWASAQSNGFDPRQNCQELLSGATDVDKMMIAAWAYGYLAHSQNSVSPVDLENNKVMLRNIAGVCQKNAGLKLVEIVAGSKKPGAETPGSEAQARALLTQFLQPNADRAALTALLKPNEADIRTVYAEPLADRLVQMYEQMYQPGVAIGPKPGQNAIITTRGLTAQLVRGDAVLRDFPGGYKHVLKYFTSDVPIVRFKFVKQGESTGMAFDGLIFVNGRWVLMPKPWRALD